MLQCTVQMLYYLHSALILLYFALSISIEEIRDFKRWTWKNYTIYTIPHNLNQYSIILALLYVLYPVMYFQSCLITVLLYVYRLHCKIKRITCVVQIRDTCQAPNHSKQMFTQLGLLFRGALQVELHNCRQSKIRCKHTGTLELRKTIPNTES